MRTKIQLNFRLLYQCIVLSLAICGLIFGGAYLWHLMLAGIFSSLAVFLSVFAVAVGLGVFLIYDAEAFQWDNNPRIAIKRITEVYDDDD